MLKISAEVISDFTEDGYLLVPSVFYPEEMAVCKKEAKLLVESKTGPSGVFVWMCDSIPQLFETISCDPRIVSILQRLIGPRVEFLSGKPVFKSSRISFASPWHQDQAYWGGSTKYSSWIALEDATLENGCLRVIPGSHRKTRDHALVKDIIGFTNRVSDDDLNEEIILDVTMKCGDILIFHDRLLHSSYPNQSGHDRWSFIPTYRNADEFDSSTTWSNSKLIGKIKEKK